MASLQAAATLMQPAKLVQLRKPSGAAPGGLSKAFGFEPSAARLTCSVQADVKDFAQRCADAAKVAGFALATSALVVAVRKGRCFHCCTFYKLPLEIFFTENPRVERILRRQG